MQAARGATVGRARFLFALVAIVAYALDQVTKILVVAHLSGRTHDVHLVGSLLRLHLTRNPGAAFSTGTAYTKVISIVALVAAVVVLWVVRRVRDPWWAVAFGFLLAGVAGNLTDRVLREPSPFRGHVVDFLRLPHWPIFNVADVCINLAALLILVQAFRGVRLDGTRDGDTDSTDSTDSTDTADTGAGTGAGTETSTDEQPSRERSE